MDRMPMSPLVYRRQIIGKTAAAELPSRLARPSFLLVIGFAMAGELLNPAYADPCEKLRKEHSVAVAKYAASHKKGSELMQKYEKRRDPAIWKEISKLIPITAKLEKAANAIEKELIKCRNANFR